MLDGSHRCIKQDLACWTDRRHDDNGARDGDDRKGRGRAAVETGLQANWFRWCRVAYSLVFNLYQLLLLLQYFVSMGLQLKQSKRLALI